MSINRRHAPSSQVSREKKLVGHQRESDYAALIEGKKIEGTQKGDVKDKMGYLHSVKSGKKWQVFLYGYDRISKSLYLKSLESCLNAFTKDSKQYFKDRIICIGLKEAYVKNIGRDAAKKLSNHVIDNELGPNEYIKSKNLLAQATTDVFKALQNKNFLRNFLAEAIFNNKEVSFLAIKDSTYKKDELFKVFSRDDILDILTIELSPALSKAGKVAEDYNVAGQKTLLCYKKKNINTNKVTDKNIVEIEIRNDSDIHYRQVRFNMYSRDVLFLLLNRPQPLAVKKLSNGVMVFGKAIETLGV